MPNERQRRAAERRRQQRQLGRRYQRYQRRRRWMFAGTAVGVLLIVALVVVFVVVTGKEDTPAAKNATTPASTASSPSSSTSSSATALPRYPCTYTAAGTSSKKGTKAPTNTKPSLGGTVSVSVATTRGPMTFRLDRSLAPCAVESFVSLVDQGYYNSTPCHRLVTAGIYVLQCGDPTGTGRGGPGYTVNDEGTGNETYKAGSIAMARTEAADSTGSQFFIVYKDSPGLRSGLGLKQYTEFGTVTSGLGVVTKVAAGGAATGTDGKPKLSISITKMTASGADQ